jgi:alpha-L-fucosidase
MTVQTFTPDLASLRQHRVPDWFKDAKLGIFLHWGPYSVPAFAPTHRSIHERDPGGSPFANNPYAEWYWNSMRFEGSPTAEHHARTYGDAPYQAFGPMFEAALANWSPEAWADQFVRAGAGYVVLTAKHHDGFLLWPSATPNPHLTDWGVRRDVVGELAAAVRARGLRLGIYYSGGIDWTFKNPRIDRVRTMIASVPGDAESYTAYAEAHFLELIERYRPDYLWNDIAYPTHDSFLRIVSAYYNAVPDGLINDRWITPEALASLPKAEKPAGVAGMLPPEPPHWDVRTPEYAMFDRLLPFDWESTRGIGKSFGYNAQETEADLLAVPELVRMVTTAACFNGNVLLNLGPRGDATLDSMQVGRIAALGDVLRRSGDAVIGTRPVALGGPSAVRIGATRSSDALYLHLLETPGTLAVDLPLPAGAEVAGATLLDSSVLTWAQRDGFLALEVAAWPDTPTQIVRLVLRSG